MYGVDWEGPAVVDDDATTVEVDDLPSLLSDEQVRELRAEIPPCTALTDEWMITGNTLVRTFVYLHC